MGLHLSQATEKVCAREGCARGFTAYRSSHRYCSTSCRKIVTQASRREFRIASDPEGFRLDVTKAATRKVNGSGYVVVKFDGWGTELEHRMVLAQALGRPLRKGESAHHRNGDRQDNRPANLELWVGGVRYGQRASEVTCPHCGGTYELEVAARVA